MPRLIGPAYGFKNDEDIAQASNDGDMAKFTDLDKTLVKSPDGGVVPESHLAELSGFGGYEIAK